MVCVSSAICCGSRRAFSGDLFREVILGQSIYNRDMNNGPVNDQCLAEKHKSGTKSK